MRLLHFNDAGNLILTNFSGRNVPPYAILSHRWGDNEVLFEDVINNCYRGKTGYRKIEFCAKQATCDQLQYFWIDTCCIDKWNLRERSMAVNSMYSWYRDAARCYVFLSDVSVSTTADAQQQSLWRGSFEASEWLTRGWTLQELIASKSVEFFSREGYRLGDKKSLERPLCRKTGIPAEALQGRPLESFSTHERQRWAESRETTEPEDSVYCLLGILGISMSTSYGEGKKKASERLQDELSSTSTSPSIIPYSKNLQFCGRESQLAMLEAKLFNDRQTTKFAITGAGGTGKSQLALELAYRIKAKDKSCSVFWVDASSKDNLYQAYTKIAEKLGLPGWDNDNADVQLLVKLHLSRETTQRWLLVFDNADDINLGLAGSSMSSSVNLVECLPQSDHGSVVFTTTDGDTAKLIAKQNIITLQELTPDAAQTMLDNYLIKPVPTSERQEMKLLLQELSYLPLAIVQAAAYITLANISLKNYRSQFAKQQRKSRKLIRNLSKAKLREHSTNDPVTRGPVTTTLLVSLDQICHTYPLAAKYLFLMACVDRRDIPQDLLGTASVPKGEDAVRILDKYALVTRRPAESALDVHRLVHLAMRNWLQEQQWLEGWTKKAIRHLLEVFPDHQYGNRSKWRRLLPHAKYVLSSNLIKQDDAARIDLAWRCAIALSSDGLWKEAEELEVQVVETSKRALGDEQASTWRRASKHAKQYKQPGIDIYGSRAMEGGRKAKHAGNGDEEASTRRRASKYANQYKQPGIDILESRAMERGGGAERASNGDEKASARRRASRHAEKHGQPGH